MEETDDMSVLHNANAVEAVVVRLPPVIGAMEIVRPIRSEEEHMTAVRNPASVFLKIAHAEQIAADRRRRQQAEKNLAIEIIGLAEGHFWRRVGCAGLGEGSRDFAGGHPQARHRTFC